MPIRPRMDMPTVTTWLDKLPLPAGEHDLEAYFTPADNPDQRLGTWQVEVQRLDDSAAR